MINSVRSARVRLKELYKLRSSPDIEAVTLEKTKSYFTWIETKTGIIMNESSFTLPSDIILVQGMKMLRNSDYLGKRLVQRGSVLWMEFGENIGQEFSGKHPGLVLKIGGETAIVIPLSSQTPTMDQKNSGIYAEVPHVYNFTSMTRWANVLNITALSIQRFHFEKVGSVKGIVLDNVKEAMKNSKVFGA